LKFVAWGTILPVDPIVLIIIVAVGMSIGIVLALAYAARLRGPAPRSESRRRVGALVTEAVPQEHPDDEVEDEGPAYSIDSPPPDPDPGLRDRSNR
jgi:pimeloyl-ACP methyl ester carboxylesterase